MNTASLAPSSHPTPGPGPGPGLVTEWPSVDLADLLAGDAGPAIPRRGYLECFYGRMWTHDERLEMLRAATRLRLNTYVYGPAADQRTGAQWREAYDPYSLQHFAELARAGAAGGIDVVWRVSPSAPLDASKGIVLSDERELQTMTRRLSELRETGISTFLVAFDDISGGPAHEQGHRHVRAEPHPLATAQGRLAGAVAAHLATLDAKLIVCPTEYWGTAASGYRRRLSELLNEGVEICWTGPDVVSASISEPDAASVRQAYGRKLWLWDNYPVNDWDDAVRVDETPTKRLFLGPLEGRAADVAQHLSAYLVNLCPAPAAALPALASAAAWAWQPVAYQPERVAAAFWTATDPSGSLSRVADLLSVSPLHPADRSGLASKVWAFLSAIDSGGDSQDAGVELRDHLSMARADTHTAMSSHSAITAAAYPWLRHLDTSIEAAIAATDVLHAYALCELGRLRVAAAALVAATSILDSTPDRFVAAGSLHPLIERARTAGGTSAPPVDFDRA